MDLFKKLILLSACALTINASSVFAGTHQNTPSTNIDSAEIGTLATIAAIDKSEILVSVVASNKNSSPSVADYAKMMISMHGENLTQLLQMADQLNATSLKGGEADAIKAKNAKDMLSLGGLSGEQFDKAYINAMVKGHEGALNLIDTKLIKTAKSDEIKKFVTNTRSVVVEHLDAAKKIQADMNTSS